nr:putative integron gene cassette protein [uncultured bacterium]
MKRIQSLAALVTIAISAASLAGSTQVEVDLSHMEPEQLYVVDTKGGPYHIAMRSEEQVRVLRERYGAGGLRSKDERFFLVRAVGPTTGCVLGYVVPSDKRWRDRVPESFVGFVDVCSCAEYDLTERLVAPNCSAPLELEVPPHEYLEEFRIMVGRANPV